MSSVKSGICTVKKQVCVCVEIVIDDDILVFYGYSFTCMSTTLAKLKTFYI